MCAFQSNTLTQICKRGFHGSNILLAYKLYRATSSNATSTDVCECIFNRSWLCYSTYIALCRGKQQEVLVITLVKGLPLISIQKG